MMAQKSSEASETVSADAMNLRDIDLVIHHQQGRFLGIDKKGIGHGDGYPTNTAACGSDSGENNDLATSFVFFHQLMS
jgi:hypothetical protein